VVGEAVRHATIASREWWSRIEDEHRVTASARDIRDNARRARAQQMNSETRIDPEDANGNTPASHSHNFFPP